MNAYFFGECSYIIIPDTAIALSKEARTNGVASPLHQQEGLLLLFYCAEKGMWEVQEQGLYQVKVSSSTFLIRLI